MDSMSEKSREELLEEIKRLQAYVAELEGELHGGEKEKSQRRAPRNELPTDIQLFSDRNLLKARGVNLSEGGVCFEIEEEIPYYMSFRHEGEVQQHRAQMIWMRRLSNGTSRFGFEFVPIEGEAAKKEG